MRASAGTAVLAIDAGLTLCKAAVYDRRGEVVAAVRLPSPGRRRGPVTHAYATAVWRTVAAAARGACARLPAGVQVQAMALSTAGVGGLIMDRAGRVQGMARPGIDALTRARSDPSWQPYGCDAYAGSSVLLAQLMERQGSDATIRSRQGSPPGVGALHTYLVWRLTGRWVCDAASGPGQLFWPDAFKRLDCDVRLPELVGNEAVVGPVLDRVARRLGLVRGTTVAAGGHDGVCASFGAGAYADGDCCLTLGTNFVPRPIRLDRPGAGFAYPIRPGRWAWSIEAPGAGHALNVVARALGDPADRRDVEATHRRLGREAALAQEEGVRPVDPALLDLDTTRLVARVRGLVRQGHSPGALYRARVDLSIDRLLARLDQARACGWRPVRYVASGGFSQNTYVMSRLVTRLASAVELVPADAGLRGAASFAAASSGLFDSPEAALRVYHRSGSPATPAPQAIRQDL